MRLQLGFVLELTFLILLSAAVPNESPEVLLDGAGNLNLSIRSEAMIKTTESKLHNRGRVHGDDTDASCDIASDIICETSSASPLVEDVLQGAEFFSKIKQKLDCRQRHKSGSWCTTMQLGEKAIMQNKKETVDVTGNMARFSICDREHLPDWHTLGEVRCHRVGGFVEQLVGNCSVNGKVGGKIYLGHEKCKIWGMELQVSRAERPAKNWG